MLLRFSVENWTSFREKAEFSMIAGPERQHSERLSRVPKYRLRILPTSAVYGGNASGKSNLFKALRFVQRQVVRGTLPDEPIPVEPFFVDDGRPGGATHFGLEILVGETIYDFRFSVTSRRVESESLTKVMSSREIQIYARRGDDIVWGDGFEADAFLFFAFKGTRANQLFLTNAVSQNVDLFKPVYDWFRKSLTLIDPDAAFEPFEMLADANNPLSSKVADGLRRLDTGVTRLEERAVDFDSILLPPEIKEIIRQSMQANTTMRLRVPETNDRYLLSRGADGTFSASRLLASHVLDDGREVTLELSREADGTQRVIDLLPAFCDLAEPGSTKVYLVDEIDRSLHTLLTRSLLHSYLDTCGPQSRSQLIFTTHDLLLMDQALLRRDEMWVTERDASGNSSLFALSEYQDIRYDKDIRKSYLQGRLGGVPRLLLAEAATDCDLQT